MEGLLDGIVVLDLGRVLACPYAATMMADMGATVIKIENPKGGDDTRKMGPFVNGNSVYYANFNRGKVGVTLNLKEPEGKEIFKEMVKKADVVLENYRPGTMEKLGLGYNVLKEVNPGIIYGSISGFGHTGPLSKRAGYDIVGQAMGGLMSTTGWPDGPATRTGTPMGDVLGALNMTVGVLAALVNKQRTGKGEKVDVALVDSVAAAMENITMIYQSTGRIPQRIGNRYESTYPYDTFPAKDGDVVIAAGNNKLYAILCDVMGKIDPIVRLQVSQLVTAYHLVCSGLGAAFISDWMVLYDHDDMRYYKIAHPLAVRQFDVVSSSRNYLSKPQKAFIESISSYYHPYL